jgi:hypothetical protein
VPRQQLILCEQRRLAGTAVRTGARNENRAAAAKARKPLDCLGAREVHVYLPTIQAHDWDLPGHDELVDTEEGELEDELCVEVEPAELVEPALDVVDEALVVDVEAAFRSAERTSAGSLPVTSWTRIPPVVERKIAIAIAMILRRSAKIRRRWARSRSAATARLSGRARPRAAAGGAERAWVGASAGVMFFVAGSLGSVRSNWVRAA